MGLEFKGAVARGNHRVKPIIFQEKEGRVAGSIPGSPFQRLNLSGLPLPPVAGQVQVVVLRMVADDDDDDNDDVHGYEKVVAARSAITTLFIQMAQVNGQTDVIDRQKN